MEFKISSEYKPAGDQIEAIEQIVSSYKSGAKRQVLLGVTGLCHSDERFLRGLPISRAIAEESEIAQARPKRRVYKFY